MSDESRWRMSRSFTVVLVTLTGFGIYFLANRLFFKLLMSFYNGFLHQVTLSYLLSYFSVLLPVIGATWFLHGRRTFDSLGMRNSPAKPFVFALICALPMTIGYSLVFDRNLDLTITTVIKGAVAAAFFEELIFRGFFFGMIFRYSRLGFISSVLLPSLVFAALHLYQSEDSAVLAGIFVTTLLGSALFAWTYSEWNFNLWVPIFLHFFMNLSWMAFPAGDTALGGIWSNVFRAMTIALIITGTLYYKRKKREGLQVNKSVIWLKPMN